MDRFTLDALAKKDLFVCMGIWLALEIVSFAMLPALRLVPEKSAIDNWFIGSLPLGIGGAFLLASSTQLSLLLLSPGYLPNRRLFRHLVPLISWLGLLGIAFPLLFLSLILFANLFSLFNS